MMKLSAEKQRNREKKYLHSREERVPREETGIWDTAEG